MRSENLMDRVLADTALSRRSFLKWSAALAGGGFSLLQAARSVAAPGAPEERVVWQSCMVNCGSRCPLRVHVRNGEIVRVETDNTGTDAYGNHQVRACVRGRSVRQRIHNVDRLKYPMKRVGMRGEAKFQRISWEQAYDSIASGLKRIKSTYGNEAQIGLRLQSVAGRGSHNQVNVLPSRRPYEAGTNSSRYAEIQNGSRLGPSADPT